MKNYQQIGVIKDVRKYVDEYDLCQRMKNRIEILVGKLMVNKILKRFQIHLTVNFVTKLLLIVGKDAILIVYDKLSKMAHFITITEEMTVKRLVQLFRDNV